MSEVQVRGIPVEQGDDWTGDQHFLLECADCGSFGVCGEDELHDALVEHLGSHGVDTTPFEKEQP